ncbi:phage regulatory protein/antirepressor Ant [Zhihengliuella halotolerans]|uniref:phage regulatory protein/antirepressor Ant n=1 Tax=Zhihengliuella halotolerans TaxID=370736 RepID=UPI0015E09DBE|nr:phage regulatory protein/antirepressor Ant [Zhihengliuella halotolerans]
MTAAASLVETGPEGVPFTSSLTIAAGAGVQHKNTLEMIERSRADLEEFGRVAFETRPFDTAGGPQLRRVALLNEHQSTLLLTYLRNTAQVRAFKKALVRAFYEMAATVTRPVTPAAAPQSYPEALRELAATVEARDAAEQRARELEVPATAWQTMVGSAGDYSVDEAAKALSRDPAVDIGRNRLFTTMQGLGWIYRDARRRWHAYQSQVDCGRLVMKLGGAYLNTNTGLMENPAPTIRVTAKGLDALRRALTPTLEVEHIGK